MFRVDQWVEPAFRALMDIPDLDLGIQHLHQIGETGVFWLMQTKAKIQEHGIKIASQAPGLQVVIQEPGALRGLQTLPRSSVFACGLFFEPYRIRH
jgi:hypothetical protein